MASRWRASRTRGWLQVPKRSTKQTRTLKTRIDIQEAAYEIVFLAIQTIVATGVNRNEAAAVRRLIYLGAHAFFGTQPSQVSGTPVNELSRQHSLYPTSPRATGISSTTVDPSASTDADALYIGPHEQALTGLLAASTPQVKIPELTHSSQIEASVAETDRPAASPFMKWKSMAISRSVVPAEAAPGTGYQSD